MAYRSLLGIGEYALKNVEAKLTINGPKRLVGLTSDCEIDLAESTTAINLYLSIIFYLLIS